MNIVLNDQGYVKSFAVVGQFGPSSINVDAPSNFDDFEQNYGSYYLSKDGKLIKDDVVHVALENQSKLAELRSQREKVCFPYINRGSVWYRKLTAEQMEELDAWYQAWLDVTNTEVIPKTPEWLV